MSKGGLQKHSYAPIKSPKETESENGVPKKVSSTLPAGAAKAGGK